MGSRLSSPKLGQFHLRTWTVLGITALVLTGGSPAIAAAPIMTSISATADSAGAVQSQGHGKVQGKARATSRRPSTVRSRKQPSSCAQPLTVPRTSTPTPRWRRMPTRQSLRWERSSISSPRRSSRLLRVRCRPGRVCLSGATGAGPVTAAVQPSMSLIPFAAPTTGATAHAVTSPVPCDRAIVRDIRANASRMKTQERAVAAAVSTYFTYCLCNPLK